MRERFCLNTATIKTTPLDRQIDLAREGGFHRIGLWLADVEAAVAQGASLQGIRARLDSSGLEVAELCFLGGWHEADSAGFEEVLKQTHHICRIARELRCEVIVTVPALRPQPADGASKRFREVCHVAADYDVRIALEFPGIAPHVKDLRSARALIHDANCRNGGLVIDTFHFFLGGSQVADFEGMTPEEILLVHISDAMNLPLENLRTPHDNRTFPGEGIIDFAPIFRQLNRLGYDGPISLEVWNRELHRSDPAEVVKKGRAALQRMESTIQAALTSGMGS